MPEVVDSAEQALLDHTDVEIYQRSGELVRVVRGISFGRKTLQRPRFFHHMLSRGIYFPPSAYEVMFISSAHTDADFDSTLNAIGDLKL